MTSPTPYEKTLKAIDEINQQDPNTITLDGVVQPKEYVYSQQMSACLAEHFPDSSDYLKIAVHAQHIKRWALARKDFAEGRVGYLTWRKELGKLHASLTSELMAEHGYNEEEQQRVGAILRKEKLKSNTESQTLEDVACLVFLAHYLEEFAAKHDEDKLISIIQKTWRKMSAQGHEIALKTPLSADMLVLVKKALDA